MLKCELWGALECWGESLGLRSPIVCPQTHLCRTDQVGKSTRSPSKKGLDFFRTSEDTQQQSYPVKSYALGLNQDKSPAGSVDVALSFFFLAAN